MFHLPVDVKNMFLRGLHVVKQDGFCNSIWAVMLIERTLMMKGSPFQQGLVSISQDENLSRKWALSLHLVSEIALEFRCT